MAGGFHLTHAQKLSRSLLRLGVEAKMEWLKKLVVRHIGRKKEIFTSLHSKLTRNRVRTSGLSKGALRRLIKKALHTRLQAMGISSSVKAGSSCSAYIHLPIPLPRSQCGSRIYAAKSPAKPPYHRGILIAHHIKIKLPLAAR